MFVIVASVVAGRNGLLLSNKLEVTLLTAVVKLTTVMMADIENHPKKPVIFPAEYSSISSGIDYTCSLRPT
jgi:hypothetical protein